MTDFDPSQVKALFLDALDLPPGERAEFLAARCGEDAELRRRVESLLASHVEADEWLGDGATTPAPTVIQKMASSTLADLDCSPGDVIGDYRLDEELGEGGFGRVFSAEQLRPVRRRVALKLLKLGMNSERVMARFETERHVLARMEHPHVARVLDAGRTNDGRPYFVMELVAGLPITRYCAENELGIEERLRLFRLVCLAIHHAHSKGILHRDIKPNNVLVTEVDGEAQPRVIDFGVAKALEGDAVDTTLPTLDGQLVGTPAYMSPEQLSGSTDIDTRSDVYGLGALLYEVIAGTTPHQVEARGVPALLELQRKALEETPAAPSAVATGRQVPREVDWICLRAIDGDPERRYPTAFAFSADLERALDGLPVEAAPASALYKTKKLLARHRAAGLFAAAALLALVLGVVTTTRQMLRADRLNAELEVALDRAESQADEARAQSEIAEAVNAFLTRDLLGAAKPSVEEGKGRDVSMAEVLQAAADRVEAASAPGGRLEDLPHVQGRVRQAIGSTYVALGRDELAIDELEAAVELLTDSLGPKHWQTLRCRIDHADALMGLGEYREAVAVLDETIPILEETVGPAHSMTLGAIKIKANAVRQQGENDESRRLAEAGLKAAEEAGTEDSAGALGVLHGLAIDEADRGNFAEAERMFLEVIERRTAMNGVDAPLTLGVRGNYAVMLLRSGREQEALELMDEVAPVMRRVLGDDHADTLVVLRNLSAVLMQSERVDDAIELAEAAYEGTMTHRGPEHPETLWTMDTLALAREAQGRVDEAVDIMNELVLISEDTLGPEHPLTANRVANFAILLHRAERWEDAEPVTWRALELADASLGPRHLHSVDNVIRLAFINRELGEDGFAEELLLDALDRTREADPAQSVVLKIRADLFRLYRDQGRWSEAHEQVEHNVRALTRALGADNVRTQAAKALVVDLLVRAGQTAEARELESTILSFYEDDNLVDGEELLRPAPE